MVLHKKDRFNANDVVTIKLTSGEEVIGYYVETNTSDIVLRKPLVPVQTGQNSLGLAPYIMSSDYLSGGDDRISFTLDSVITLVKTEKKFADVFVQQMSGLYSAQGPANGSANGNPGLITS